MHPHGQRRRHRPLGPRQGRLQGRGAAGGGASGRRRPFQPVPLKIAPTAENALFVMAITSVWPRPPYLLDARRAGRLSDSPNPRAVLTYAEPGTSPASPRGFLFCGRVLQASILVGKGERRARAAQSTRS